MQILLERVAPQKHPSKHSKLSVYQDTTYDCDLLNLRNYNKTLCNASVTKSHLWIVAINSVYHSNSRILVLALFGGNFLLN